MSSSTYQPVTLKNKYKLRSDAISFHLSLNSNFLEIYHIIILKKDFNNLESLSRKIRNSKKVAHIIS